VLKKVGRGTYMKKRSQKKIRDLHDPKRKTPFRDENGNKALRTQSKLVLDGLLDLRGGTLSMGVET